MLRRLLAGTDRFLARARPTWAWIGQAGLVFLGVHLAADHVDDTLAQVLTSVPIPWPDLDTPREVGTWAAVALELLTCLWAVHALARTAAREPVASFAAWRDRASLHNLVAPMVWVPLAGAGCWVVAMAVEDLAAPVLPPAAPWLGGLAAALVGWRLAWTGGAGLVRRAPPPARRSEGWLGALVVLPMAAVAARHGLPVWGWLP